VDQEPIRSADDLPAALVAELARLRAVERGARDICARCERGEIRSVSTYTRFRAALVSREDASLGATLDPPRATGDLVCS
jgi:hypothetical protein